MKIALMADIHLEFLNVKKRKEFFRSIQDAAPDAVLIGGDIATPGYLESWLIKLQSVIKAPICFCMGNHDYYGSSIFEVRELARKITKENPNISWLPAVGRVELEEDVLLVGHGCWGDARAGSIFNSDLELADFIRIEYLKGLSKYSRREILMRLGSESADYLSSVLDQGIAKYRQVIVLTHVPPFPQSCFYMGQPSDEGLPYFCCKAAGDVLRNVAKENPAVEFSIYSGHTHDPADVQILGNLRAMVLGAEYGRPTFTILNL